jgi:large subunit ribosomal protein L35
MPKMKSKRSAAKRFSFTGSGKVKRNHAFHRHNMTHKSQASKVGTRGTTVAFEGDAKLIKLMLPYGD